MAPRTRYAPSDDKIILEEVIAINPFEDPARWHTITEKVSSILRRTLNSRSVKERVDLLLAQFLRNDAKNRKKSGTEEEYRAVDVLLQHVADLAAECSYRPPRSAIRKHRAKTAQASAPESASDSASVTAAKRVKPPAQAPWDGRRIAALECDGAASAAAVTQQSAGRSQNEATLAFLEARYDQDTEMRLLSYSIDKRKLDLQIRQHEDNMKLLHQQHADNMRLREAEMEIRRLEMAAILEERRANAAYQTAQLELIKGLVQKTKE
ncbi:hypothetical protein MTO96_022498 [Rhipicephalus appendiculatus]